jgi:hypothetical protein
MNHKIDLETAREAHFRKLKIKRATRQPQNQNERDYLAAWENAEFFQEARKHGLMPDLPPLPAITQEEDDPEKEKIDPLDVAAFQGWKDHDDHQTKNDTPNIVEGHEEAIETRARELAAQMLRDSLDAMTRSRFSCLARQAETFLLAFSPSHATASKQTDIARKYGVTRACISRDVAHIRKHKSIGLITNQAFTSEALRKERSKNAKEIHAKQKAENAAPPAGSISNLVDSFLSPSPKPKS